MTDRINVSTFIVLVFLNIPYRSYSATNASGECVNELSGKLLFLPESETLLRQHPIWSLRKATTRNQTQLNFVFFAFSEKKRHDPKVQIDKSMRKILGESIQTRWLMQFIKKIWPDATFRLRAISGKKNISLMVYDSAEFDPNVYSMPKHPENILDMPLLKTANPTFIYTTKDLAKANLGIPTDKKVISIYINDLVSTEKSTQWNPSIPDIVSNLPSDDKPDMIFISRSNSANMAAVLERKNLIPRGFDVASFRGDAVPTVSDDRPSIVLNNTAGRMLEIYAASDYAIVIGPNNIFEPLQVKTPVIFLNNEYIQWYNQNVFDEMSRTARATGGAFRINDISSLSKAISKAARVRGNIKHPAFVEATDGSGPAFVRVLDRLMTVIKSQLR